MLSNQAEHLSQSALTRFAVIVRLMTQVLPMPLPLDHPCKESRCFWMQEMKHETKVDLMRNLFLMARHFAAACFTLRARRDTDGARVVVSAALAAVMDTLLRRCLTDTLHGSLASRHYAGLAPGPCSAFGVELGEFHSASETLLLVAPEYQALRTLVLDYFDSVSRCVAAEHMIFSFDKSMACSEGEMTLVEQIGLCLGLDAAKRDAPRLLTGERPELIELFPELAWFRDTVFLWKMLLLPACQCPAVQKWSSADSLLKWQYRKGRFEVIGFGTTLTAEANGKGDSFFRGVLRWFGQYDSDKKSLSRANPSVLTGDPSQQLSEDWETARLEKKGEVRMPLPSLKELEELLPLQLDECPELVQAAFAGDEAKELLIGGADPNTIWLREERLKGSDGCCQCAISWEAITPAGSCERMSYRKWMDPRFFGSVG
eukprot:symbB.v1.2.022536.t3/scaffold2007.1/size92683/1